MSKTEEALPPLPEPDFHQAVVTLGGSSTYRDGFSAETLQAYARAALAQRQQVPDVRIEDDNALRYVQRVLESAATPEDRASARDEIVKIRTRIRKYALTAAPPAQQSAQPEQRVWPPDTHIDVLQDSVKVEAGRRRVANAKRAEDKAQPEQQPVAWHAEGGADVGFVSALCWSRAAALEALSKCNIPGRVRPLVYGDATQPRAVDPLTDEQIENIRLQVGHWDTVTTEQFARAIERAHGIGKQEQS